MPFLRGWYRELKRRKVLRVAAAYAVVAWGAIEVAETVFPILMLPPWLVTAVTVLALLGFPLAVALAWAFDLTDTGIQRAEADPGAEGTRVPDGPSRAVVFWATLAIAAVAVAGWVLLEEDDPIERSERSVAVLPFENLSRVAENEFFSDGITEDILTNLSNIADLRVISRTSAMAYKDTDKTIPEIATELDVAYVLEGSVRRVGERVRITAQLVHAPADRHVWATNYDRELTDIFAIQSEIARAIARELRTELSPEEQERIAATPTEDMAAYDQYLKGRALLDQRGEAGMRRAIDHFQRAIARDPGYALAWAGLADAISLLGFYDYIVPDTAPSALEAARRAVELDGTLGHAHASLGIVHSIRQDAPAALRHLRRAIELTPGYAEPYIWLAWVLLLTGSPEEAVSPAEEAVRQDPLAPAYHVYLGETYLAVGDPDDALGEVRTAIDLQPQYGLAHFMEALVLHHLERYPAARTSLGRARRLVPEQGTPTHDEIDAVVALTFIAEGDTVAARDVLQRIGASPASPEARFSVGLVHAALGDIDTALDIFTDIDRWGPFSNDHIRYFFPDQLAAVRADPRYLRLLDRVDRAWNVR